MTHAAYIAIGSNLGDRAQNLRSAVDAIARHDDITLVNESSIIETPPVGDIEQGPYLNGVIHIQTTLPPRALLNTLLRIESTLGRDRSKEQRWGPRTIDLDLIIYTDHIINEPGLQVPHPRLHERSFVLIPLVEIAPDLLLPVHNETPRRLLKALNGVS
ncbi:MAG: 2-amino-4-hydroxy-6-hydroxymethyldihydropteridine diphosphokinase [Phycisphaerales bacterium]|nr:2-amino-4-hydroxy-6-hydroxymethyldihydropteridine diphosphokinase [Phycisphaerales bacterium]